MHIGSISGTDGEEAHWHSHTAVNLLLKSA